MSSLHAEISPAVASIVSHRSQYLVDAATGARRLVSLRRLIATGVIIDESGLLVTSDRVAQPGDSILVYLSDGSCIPASFVDTDGAIHISLLQLLGPRPFPALHGWLEWEGGPLPEWMAVVAHGPWQGNSPGKPALTLCHRDAIESSMIPCGDALEAIWRVRAPMHPGNSGGALVTLDGEWVGLITGALASAGAANSTSRNLPSSEWEMGLALPATVVRKAVEGMRAAHEPATSLGFLGVSTRRPGAAEVDSLPQASGIVVSEVLRNSPASRAGLIPGDVILQFEDLPISDVHQLTHRVAETPPGTPAVMDILRHGVAHKIHVEIGDRDAVEMEIARRSRLNLQRAALRDQIEWYQGRIAQLRDQLGRMEPAVRQNTGRAESSGR